MTRPTIVAGNWKLQPPRGEGVQLYQSVCTGVASQRIPDSVEVFLFPPFPYLSAFEASHGVCIGAQDVSTENWGAFTGEVGAGLLKGFGVTHVLVGHSERRHVFGETDDVVHRKVRALLDEGMAPVLCIGETEAERDAGDTTAVLARQLEVALDGVSPAEFGDSGLVLAYEPVWAIGTGRTATPEIAVEAHSFVRARLASQWSKEIAETTPILYGGSVKPANAAELLREDEIDGALVGGASLEADSFLAILAAAVEVEKTQGSL